MIDPELYPVTRQDEDGYQTGVQIPKDGKFSNHN